MGSATNKYYALRDRNQAEAFLRFPETEGVDLRANYMEIMEAVAEQLENNVDLTVNQLVGSLDARKLKSSLVFFETVSRTMKPSDEEMNRVCLRALRAVENAPKRPHHDPWRTRWVLED